MRPPGLGTVHVACPSYGPGRPRNFTSRCRVFRYTLHAHCTVNARMSDFVTITEAATRLTAAGEKIDRSSLSRYLKQHGEAGLTTDDNLVDFERLVAHRQENIRLRARTSVSTPARSSTASQTFPRTQSDGAARKAQADAELREMDLAERRKELTPVAEVDQGGRDAVALMSSAFERAIETEAATLSLKYGWDERTVRVALKEFSRLGLSVFNREVLLRLDAMKRELEADLPISDLSAEGAALQ